MITPWDVYWIAIMDDINFVCFFGLLTFLVISAVAWVRLVGAIRDGQRPPGSFRISVILTALFAFFSIAGILAPNTKEAAAIYMLPKIVNNEKIQALPENAVDFLNEQMKAWVEDLRGGAKK